MTAAAGLARSAPGCRDRGGLERRRPPTREVLPGMLLIGLGAGLLMPTATDAVIGSVPRAEAGVGSATNGVSIQVGGALGDHPAIVQGPAISGRAGRRSLPAGRDGQSFHRASGRIAGQAKLGRSGSADGPLRPQFRRRGARQDRLSFLARADHRRAAKARRNPPLHRGQAAAGFRRAGARRSAPAPRSAPPRAIWA